MISKAIGLWSLALSVAVFASAQSQPGKVGVISIQQAIIGTKDGQKAAAELQSKADPKRKEIQSKQSEVASLKDQLQKGENTLSEVAKQELVRNIDTKTKSLNRDMEDANAELNEEQQKVLQQLGQKMMVIIDKYAKDNGYSIILDVSSQQTPVLYASNGIDITRDIIALYDKNADAPATGAAATPHPPATSHPTAPATKRP
ncbi:MAG: OmpH family outer membrane protein [Bryobacteraceae bacterium]